MVRRATVTRPQPSIRSALAGIAVAVATLWGLIDQARPAASPPPPLPCRVAVLIDGQLHCDEEVPTEIGALCPNPGPQGSEAIASGDALDTARLCALRTVERGDVASGWSRMPAAQLAALAVPVDLNRASEEELTSLPRIGPVLARRIAQGRPYAGVDALTTVRGIGPVTLERLRSRVVVGPVDP